MFSEELNKLIEASLVDGVITDQERTVIRKRALLEGVDPDEVDLMLDAEIQKIRQKQEEAVAKVKKCPACGEIIPAMSVICPSCGYEFRDIEANSSVKNLFSMVNEIYSSNEKDSAKEERLKMVINNFPVPNTKEDILEFLFLAVPNAKIDKTLIAKFSGGIIGGVVTLCGMIIIGICLEIINTIQQGGFGPDSGFGLAGPLMLGWWLPFVVGYFANKATKQKHEDLVKKNRLAAVWKSKCEQVLMKAKYVFANNHQLLAKITEYENEIK